MRPPLSETTEYLLAVLRAVLNGTAAPLPGDGLDWEQFYTAASLHTLAPMVYHGIYDLGLPEDKLARFTDAHRANMLTFAQQNTEIIRISAALEEAGIEYCPLKGCYTRELYPDPSMRVMCDIDMLIHDSDREKVREAMERIGYECARFGGDLDDKYKRGRVIVEMHNRLDAGGLKDPSYYDDPWRLTESVSAFCRRLTPVHEYLYTIAHALKHLVYSGMGLRIPMDIYLYLTRFDFDREEAEAEAVKMGVSKFMHCMERIALAAFGGGEFDEDTALVFMFILQDGHGESFETHESSQMIKSSAGRHKVSRAGYLLRQVFPPLEDMRWREPVLNKAPILLPAMYVKRWFQLVFTMRDRLSSGLQRISSADTETAERVKRIYEIAGVNQ